MRHVHWTANKMIAVDRTFVNGDAEGMAVLLSYSSVMRLTVYGAGYKHMLSTHTHKSHGIIV